MRSASSLTVFFFFASALQDSSNRVPKIAIIFVFGTIGATFPTLPYTIDLRILGGLRSRAPAETSNDNMNACILLFTWPATHLRLLFAFASRSNVFLLRSFPMPTLSIDLDRHSNFVILFPFQTENYQRELWFGETSRMPSSIPFFAFSIF